MKKIPRSSTNVGTSGVEIIEVKEGNDINVSLEHLQLVFLDYQLGDGRTGGKLMKPIKDRALDLPIIAFQWI